MKYFEIKDMVDSDDKEATVRPLTAYRIAITGLVRQYRGRIADPQFINGRRKNTE